MVIAILANGDVYERVENETGESWELIYDIDYYTVESFSSCIAILSNASVYLGTLESWDLIYSYTLPSYEIYDTYIGVHNDASIFCLDTYDFVFTRYIEFDLPTFSVSPYVQAVVSRELLIEKEVQIQPPVSIYRCEITKMLISKVEIERVKTYKCTLNYEYD